MSMQGGFCMEVKRNKRAGSKWFQKLERGRTCFNSWFESIIKGVEVRLSSVLSIVLKAAGINLFRHRFVAKNLIQVSIVKNRNRENHKDVHNRCSWVLSFVVEGPG